MRNAGARDEAGPGGGGMSSLSEKIVSTIGKRAEKKQASARAYVSQFSEKLTYGQCWCPVCVGTGLIIVHEIFQRSGGDPVAKGSRLTICPVCEGQKAVPAGEFLE